MELTRRYHNVFYAYRGQAPGDPLRDGPRQLETNVTRALLVTLEHAGPDVTARFVRDLASDGHAASNFEYALEVPYRDPAGGPVVLLGLSPDGRIAPDSLVDPRGDSRIDALIDAPGQVRVLVESKITGGCDGSQLWRHARAWGQPEPVRRGGNWQLPTNWVQRGWADVRAFCSREAAHDEVTPVGRFLLGQLADYLDLCGIGRDAPLATARRRSPARHDDGREAIVGLGLATTDWQRVRRACEALYGGPGRSHYVDGDGCRADGARVMKDYAAAGLNAPPELIDGRGAPANVITPRRALSILYGPDDYAKTVAPASPSAGARKFLARGIDRAVLLGMLAWAETDGSPTYARNIRGLVAMAWTDAAAASPCAPELTTELRRSGVTVPLVTSGDDPH